MRPPKLTVVKKAEDETALESERSIESALRTIAHESNGLTALSSALQQELRQPFALTVNLVKETEGRVIVSGMGKSGHVGTKIAATLASTGTPAFFVHPSEASHGDLGMIALKDVILALSWSGETAELENVIDYSRRYGVPLVSVTSNSESTLAKASDVALVLPVVEEACPHGLAPTTSSVMQLALGDALAIALLESKGFTASDFKAFHPGGRLGAQLKHVGDIMHAGAKLPLATPDTPMSGVILTMTERSFGCLGVLDEAGVLCGIVTDGDLRRNMSPKILNSCAEDIMTRNPITVSRDTLVSAALEILNSSNITALFVVDEGRPVGIVHIHDLLRIGAA
ncbi:MAG: KpsF/GutQ family sugar-phosphate isomerase [Fimbriimonadaceae bacterium]|nr:KpsF/GutQ family sugar-phosphate isomerase [Alphaproteobacteria bacterium]